MKKNPLVSIVVIILLANLAGCRPAADTPNPESISMPEPYTVTLTAADFVSVVDNQYFPLTPGTKWVYQATLKDGTIERNELEVLQEVRNVMGVQATIVHDVVLVESQLVEETYDWYAQDKDGNVWYLGEDVDNYENGVIANHEGSWEWGVNGALPGVIMWADPSAHLNEEYYQEFYAGEAEDKGQVLSVTEKVTIPFGSYENVVKTYDFSTADPDLKENKFYAAEIGNIREIDLATGEEVVLIEFSPAGKPATLDLPLALDSQWVDLVEPTFSNPTSVTNPLFPASLVTKILLLSQVDGQPLHVEFSLPPSIEIIE